MVLKRFYGFVFRHKAVFFVATFLVIGSSVLTNLIPIILRSLVNAVQANQYEAALSALFFIILLKASELLLNNAAQYMADLVAIRSAIDARRAVFKHLHDLDFHYHANKSSGKLIGIFRRGEGAFIQYYEEINMTGTKTILDFIFLLIIFSQLYPKLLYFCFGIFVLNSFVMYLTIRFNIKERHIFNKSDDELTMITVDNMVAFDTIKYFAGEKREQRRLNGFLARFEEAFIRYVLTFRVMDISNGGILAAGSVGMIGIAVFDLIQGSITMGDFVLVISLSSTFASEMRGLVYRIRNLAKLQTDLWDYLGILDEEITVKDVVDKDLEKRWKKSMLHNPRGAEIVFDKVSFSYGEGRSNALSNISLTIKPNESIAFVGVSGVGKTTLTKLIMRFYDPTEGEIRINGVPIHKIAKTALRSAIGIVPQEAILFNHSIGYNIAYGDPDKDERALKKALKMAHLDEFVAGLPQGLDTIVGERGIKLSGGQKQRLAIARAFMKDAPIVVFDEATSSLDSESEKLIQDAFWKLARNKTTIIIAHRLSTIQKVDRIIVFDKGGIVDEGTHQELKSKTSGLYKYLWELQSAGEL
jgi:ATP-binding cassette subfamily B protein